MKDYSTWLELEHKNYKLNETVTFTNNLKTKVKIRNTTQTVLPNTTVTLVKTKKGWKIQNS